ncbi:MAG: hypothetical protein WC667_11940 [Sulfurimonas sp.]|jgi:hypothetical protein
MKVAVECKSPLLQKSLEIFLSKYLCSVKQCDIVVRDEECIYDERCFYISSSADSDLVKPFSKSQLILALENKYRKSISGIREEIEREYGDEGLNFDILERRIELLTQEYKQNIIRAVKAFYEK